MEQAEKNERKAHKKASIWQLLIGNAPTEYERADLFQTAGGQYEIAGNALKAAECYYRSAQLGNTCSFINALKIYAELDIDMAYIVINKAIEVFTERGNTRGFQNSPKKQQN